MPNINNLTELAATLASRLKKQRDKWVDAFYQAFHDFEPIRKHHKLNVKAALPIVSAFQVVHVISFIHMNKYLKEEYIGDFIAVLTELLYGLPTEEWMQYVKVYQFNKQKDFLDQLCCFCEDVSVAITGSHAGMLYGPGFIGMAKEFLYRNWGIVADHFGDKKMLEECAKVVKALHKKNST
jgi:hypothetical protein